MPKLTAAPRLIGTPVLVLLALALAAVALPASALAAPEEGSGTLKVSPDPVVLPTTTVGNQSLAQPVQISYEGEGEVSINKVTIEGGESGEFFLNGSNCGNLSNGQSCEAWLGLKPSTTGEKVATLTVTFNGLRPEEKFAIGGRGAPAQLSFDPASYDFGLRRVNRENGSTTFQVQNVGEADVQINNFEIAGPGSNAFWTGNSNCWGNWLAPGQSCSMQVWFNPQEQVGYEVELRALANGSVASASLKGEGGRAIVQASESPVGFGAAGVGSAGATRTITLENVGNMPEGFFIGVIAGGDAGSFRLLDEHCTFIELSPGATCTAHVRFSPASAGTKTAHMAFFGEGEGGVIVQLSGEGIAPAVSLLPGSFDFGAQAAGTRSTPHGFAVRNEGTTSLGLDRVAILGADLDQFGVAGDECTGATLAPGDECLVRVRFAPDSGGLKNATLRVSGDSGVLTAALTGSGSGAAAEGTGAAVTSAAAPAVQPPAPRPLHRRHRRFVRSYDVNGDSGQPARRGNHSRR